MRLIHPSRKRARNHTAKSEWILASYKDCPVARSVAKLAFNATLYHIWFERNLRHFHNSSRTKDRIISDIIFEVSVKTKILKAPINNTRIAHYLDDCWGVNRVGSDLECGTFSWPFPQANYMVLSCDGSMQSGRGGYGGLIRDDQGNPVVGYASTSNNLHVLWLEMFSTYRGMKIAIENGALYLCIYSDSKLGVDIVLNKSRCPWRLLCIKRKFEDMSKTLMKVQVQHVWREANQLADFLANWDHLQANDIIDLAIFLLDFKT